jgi:TatD DNase family protein
MELVDSHAHLTDTRFAADRTAVLERARQAGVVEMLTVGSGDGLEGAERAVALAAETPGLWASVGVHPHEAAMATEEMLAQLDALARHPRVVAWGEIGLDYHYPDPPPEVQKRALLRQLELARRARLPVIIHCRQAWEDCLEILEAEWKPAGLGGVLHCFSGTREHAARGLEMGLYVSFAANLAYPSAAALREVARWVPLDRLLLETDSPYLPPQGRRGQRNEPALVAEVAKVVANVRDLSVELVAAATAENFRRLFRRDGGGQPSQS